jgi:hypothetical protein
MTAGRGIVHSEIPRPNADGTPNIGLQLWVDLPQKLKKCEPRYRDLQASEIPEIDIDNNKVHIKIISGKSHGVDSVKKLAYTPVWIFDIEIKPGGKVTQGLPPGWNAFAYTLNGTTTFVVGQYRRPVERHHNVVFEQKGDNVSAEVKASSQENGHFRKYLLGSSMLFSMCLRIASLGAPSLRIKSNCFFSCGKSCRNQIMTGIPILKEFSLLFITFSIPIGRESDVDKTC